MTKYEAKCIPMIGLRRKLTHFGKEKNTKNIDMTQRSFEDHVLYYGAHKDRFQRLPHEQRKEIV
jgi:hypothetical protein